MDQSKMFRLILSFVCIFVEIYAKDSCAYRNETGSTAFTNCPDGCCTRIASSLDSACCSSFSWSAIAVSFFVIAGVCILAICLIYCRPMWKNCLCGHKCPCGQRSRVNTANPTSVHDNPVYVLNNDGLPDYDTSTKTPHGSKETTLPTYTFVAEHPDDFGLGTRLPSAPPQYQSRRTSVATTTAADPSAPSVL